MSPQLANTSKLLKLSSSQREIVRLFDDFDRKERDRVLVHKNDKNYAPGKFRRHGYELEGVVKVVEKQFEEAKKNLHKAEKKG